MIEDKSIEKLGAVGYHLHNGNDTPKIPIQSISNVLYGHAVYNPNSLANGDGETTTVSVIGAVLGDWVITSFSLNLQDITLTSYVSANNTVSVRFQNESGITVDLASGTLKCLVIKQLN